jgi:nucleoid-associated protein YgaU
LRQATRYLIGAALLLLLGACAPPVVKWRADALKVVDRVKAAEGRAISPEEFADLEFTLRQGELLLAADEAAKADNYFLLTVAKGKLLEEAIAREKQRREAVRRQEEAQRLDEARRRAEELAREQLLAQERAEAQARQQAEAEAAAAERLRMEKARLAKEKPLPTSHAVKRGETLPQIAAQAEVYGDASLWPLLYRANRDQIRDPRIVWPGQVLRIPRNASREEQAEARRYSQEKPLR